MKTAKIVLDEIKKHYVIIDTEGTGDEGALKIIKDVLLQIVFHTPPT